METFTLILEIIYYLSAPAIAIIAIIGLKQISVTKENRKINSKRESIKLASDQCKFYMDVVVKDMNKIDSYVDKNKIEIFNREKVKIENGVISSPILTEKNTTETEKLELIREDIASVINSLETFSIPFTCKVANDIVAYRAVGKDFVEFVKDYMPIFILNFIKGYHKNTLELFIKWENFYEKEKIMNELKKINKKIKDKGTVVFDSKTIGSD